MSDTPNPKKGELTLSKDRSLAIKRSGLVKRGLELIHELKKRQVQVIIGDHQDNLFKDIFTDIINDVIGDKYDLKIKCSSYADELLQLAENGVSDIFILILNNMYFRHMNFSVLERVENSFQIITQISAKYGRPVIALAGWPHDSSVATRAKLAGANFYFPLPCKVEGIMEAIEKCLGSSLTLMKNRENGLTKEIKNMIPHNVRVRKPKEE